MMEKSNWTFDLTLENATEDQADDFFAVIIALAKAMNLQIGGGVSQEVDDGTQDN